MSQSPDTDTLILVSSEASEPDAVTLVDSYAEQLMDDLFDDVDRLLDGEEAVAGKLSTSFVDAFVAEEESTSLVVPTPGVLDPLGGVLQLNEPGIVTKSSEPPKPKQWGRLFARLLMALAASSALGVGALWAISEYRLNQADLGATTEGISSPDVQAQPQAEFMNYLQRSLEVIANRESEPSTDSSTAVPNVAVLPGSPLIVPPAPIASNPLPSSSGRPSVNVIERVYIPYQPSQVPTAAAPAAGTAPARAAAPAQPQPAVAAANHVLVGVLELGARSAALFEIDGVSQRVYIGERIGNSGWSLVSVSNEQTVIRRNGEVRSIYIGQKF
ncbi:MAG TPA: hypothetical protein V6D07_13730 [Trichocoleus sp.]